MSLTSYQTAPPRVTTANARVTGLTNEKEDWAGSGYPSHCGLGVLSIVIRRSRYFLSWSYFSRQVEDHFSGKYAR
jgi:hypothetical protein